MTDDEVREYVREEIAREEEALSWRYLPSMQIGRHRIAAVETSRRLEALRAILDALPEPNLWARAMGAK